MALSDEELKKMESSLKAAFDAAAKSYIDPKGIVFDGQDSTNIAIARSLTAQALLAVDAEIRRRGLDSGYKPGDM